MSIQGPERSSGPRLSITFTSSLDRICICVRPFPTRSLTFLRSPIDRGFRRLMRRITQRTRFLPACLWGVLAVYYIIGLAGLIWVPFHAGAFQILNSGTERNSSEKSLIELLEAVLPRHRGLSCSNASIPDIRSPGRLIRSVQAAPPAISTARGNRMLFSR